MADSNRKDTDAQASFPGNSILASFSLVRWRLRVYDKFFLQLLTPNRAMTSATYCKRLIMTLDLEWIDPPFALPIGFTWLPWTDARLKAHAAVQWQSFRDEFDSRIFPNFSRRDGCLRMMEAIRDQPDFLPAATWLITRAEGDCGSIQCRTEDQGRGMIHNVAIVPEYRRQGLGRALMLKALHGMKAAGVRQARLEVTARNRPALHLYHQLGFRIQKSCFRELVPIEEPSYVI